MVTAQVVGLVEAFDASLCLWGFQFGAHLRDPDDYKDRCDCRGRVRREAAERAAASLRGDLDAEAFEAATIVFGHSDGTYDLKFAAGHTRRRARRPRPLLLAGFQTV